MQCVTECSRLKSTGVDSDVINAHDKDYTSEDNQEGYGRANEKRL